MPTPKNKNPVLNWAVTTGRIQPLMRQVWANTFAITDDPDQVERTLIGLPPSGNTPNLPVPKAWASVAAAVNGPAGRRVAASAKRGAADPDPYPQSWLTPGERRIVAARRQHGPASPTGISPGPAGPNHNRIIQEK